MAARQGLDCPTTWRPRSKLSSEIQFNICGAVFTVDKELLLARSARLAKLEKESPQDDLSHIMQEIPADPEALEIVARFCHGFEINLSTENALRVACLAYYLEMTESHCVGNLLNKALHFIEDHIIPSWNHSIKALKSTETILQKAACSELFDACMESIVMKALEKPCLLGEPLKIFPSDDDSGDNENDHKPTVRRRLFGFDWKSEDLTVLCLRLYEPIISAMVQRQVPQEYVAASLCQYVNNWIFSVDKRGEDVSIYKMNHQREIIQALERLLPDERGLLPCTFLSEMLRYAIDLDASNECRNGLEMRIGKQLDKATVEDLLIPTHGYAKNGLYDTGSVRRILRNFYSNYTGTDASGLITVAELVDDFLAEVASDIDLSVDTFIALADMAVAASDGTPRTSDGIYRAIDIYFDKHMHLTESEKEEVCKALDCNKMSPEACQHAAQNGRLPMRVVVQVLFTVQLQLRDTITREVKGSDNRLLRIEEEGEEEEEEVEKASSSEEMIKAEMEKMGSKVMELEKECNMMRRTIQSGCCNRVKKEKVSMWKEMKRKFGCMTNNQSCNCHVKKKKVHPR